MTQFVAPFDLHTTQLDLGTKHMFHQCVLLSKPHPTCLVLLVPRIHYLVGVFVDKRNPFHAE
jgi:hypothetical protein